MGKERRGQLVKQFRAKIGTLLPTLCRPLKGLRPLLSTLALPWPAAHIRSATSTALSLSSCSLRASKRKAGSYSCQRPRLWAPLEVRGLLQALTAAAAVALLPSGIVLG